jgi:hypothetical protein
VGVLEETIRETLLVARLVVSEHAGNETRDGFDDDERRKLAAGKDVIAHGQLFVDQVIGYALVNAFVATAEEAEPTEVAELESYRLVEAPPTGR